MKYCAHHEENIDTNFDAGHFDEEVECHATLHGKDLTELRPHYDDEGSYGFYCTDCKKFVGDTQEATRLANEQIEEQASLNAWVNAGGW